ncbi:hypothetical protein HHK36_032467 [Tetracentron sinense]|uniref:Uncharacterized protein n=1 Tax=Tetracentron sinense TaxID=13715 RepID=A0A834Y949_TETSI|nr:hypothetical protein HHK36_032467 [Tetracentron sinense]
MSLKCALQLGIPDIIHHHGRPITLSELLTALAISSTKTDSLWRLMRILVHSGFIARGTNRNEEETYLLTPSSQLLVKENSMNMLAFAQVGVGPLLTTPWNSLGAWFRQPESTCFEMANGTTFWDLASQHPELNNLFNEAMANDTRLLMTVVVRDCSEVFRSLRSLVDVGGGTGTTARIISEAFPHIKCTILDLPHVWILHDWSDEDCVKILRRCKEAIPSKEEGGKVIILDMVVNEDMRHHKSTETQLFFDMMMMVNFGGKERSEFEWLKIFTDAGFTQYKIKPILDVRSIMEIYP